MTFLAPTALIGLLLLAIPILVHLFKPRKMRRTPFSSLRWLKQTHQRLSRRVQWHQWLLFLMRAGAIVLLVLALAKPLIGSRAGERAADRYVILDVGQTMSYQQAEMPTPLAQAQDLAEKIVTHARPGDRTALVLAGAAPRILTGPVADAASHLPALRAARVQESSQPLTSVLPLVRALAASHEQDRDLDLVFLTDHRRHSWRQDEIQAFMKGREGKVRVQIVDAAPASGQNAWISGARLLDLGSGDAKVLRAELSCVGEARLERSLRLTGLRDLADDVQSVILAPGHVTRADFKIPASLPVAGQFAELRLEPADALASDDRWFVNLDTGVGLRMVLIEPADGEPGRGSGLHLRAALEALAESNNQAFTIQNRTHKSIAAGEVLAADLVILAGVPDLPDAILQALEGRVQAGAGVLMFLGEGMNLPFYNQKLHRPLQPADGLLPVAIQTKEPSRTEGVGALSGLRWSHPLLAPLRDPVLSDLQQVRFRKYVAWAGALGPNDTILARIDDGEPALIERPFGAGRVLICNTSPDDAWADLPRRRCFVPLLDRMVAYLTGGGLRREFVAGESTTMPLPEGAADPTISVVSPSGSKMTSRLIHHGSKAYLHFDDIAEAGAYRGEQAGKPFAFVANVNRAGSPLTAMDGATLESWWAPASVEVVNVETATRQITQSGAWPLWPALLFLAGLLLLAETIYVHRLCPRSDPAVVESIVPQRGVLQPLNKEPV